MGRMWEALRRGNSAPSEVDEARGNATPLEDAEPMLVAADEIPFIEVGPHKSMEASPSVLAFSQAARQTASAAVVAASRAATDGPTRLAAPRSAPFRAVFLATPEMEAETPPIDPLTRLIDYL